MKIKKLLTNEAFLGVISLTILGGLAIWEGNMELATGTVAAIGAMLRGEKGEA